MAVGWTLDRRGYAPVWIAAGTVPLIAWLVPFLMFDRRRGGHSTSRRRPLFAGSARHGGDRLDLHQELRQRQRRHADEGVRRRRGITVERANLAENGPQLVW